MKNKQNIFLLILFVLILLVSFLTIKNEFYYASSNYITNYLDYYVQNYLNMQGDKLFVDGSIFMYVEGDLKYLYSAFYLYVVTYGTTIFKIFMIIFPILLFHKVMSKFYDELYNKFIICKITRMSNKKYINNLIIKNGLCCGLLMVIPKLIFLLILVLFFPVGVSSTHFVSYASFISQAYLYVGFELPPVIMIILDLVLSFLYGVFISIISLIITTLTKTKPISYIIFIFVFIILSIVMVILRQAPIISYMSIYCYANEMMNFTSNINFIYPFVFISVLLIITLVASKIILSGRIKNNI